MSDGVFVGPKSKGNFEALVAAIAEGNASAFLGAGLGRQAGLPGWQELLEKLCEASDLAIVDFSPRTVAGHIGQLREQLGERYLPELKRLLDPTTLELPAACRTLADIPFARFLTTNIDELLYMMASLAENNPDSLTCAYPTLAVDGSKYFYLHGRLRTARSPSQVVLCESDYREAYDTNPSPVGATLLHLLRHPVLFLASSLLDPDLDHLMRVLLRSQVFRAGPGEGFRAQPPWYAMMAANAENLGVQPAIRDLPDIPGHLPELMEAREQNDPLIRFIWYKDDPNHSSLDIILREIGTLTRQPQRKEGSFMAQAEELEELAALSTPTTGQIERVLEHLRFPTHRRHFLRYATASWLPILWARGHLREFTDPQLGSDGYYRVSEWDAADFVHRSASAYPDVVLQMIKGIQTDNWLVIYGLARALQNLPADTVSQAIPAVDGWLSRRFAVASPASMALSELLKRLVREQEWDAALALFGVLVKWKVTDDGA